MKKIIAIALAALFVFASCGQPAETTGAPETNVPNTDAPSTDASETNAPSTDAPTTDVPATEDTFEVPSDPTFDPDVEEKEEEKVMLYDFDFTNEIQTQDGFTPVYEGFDLVAGSGLKNSNQNGIVRINDEKLSLASKSFMVEIDVTFNTLPHKADGVTNFPSSVISWIRTSGGNITYDWIVKLDDQGNFYVANSNTPTGVKIAAGEKHTLGVWFNTKESTCQFFLDGVAVTTRNLTVNQLTGSCIRIFDGGAGKAHFDATLHAARAYECDSTSFLKDAERSVYDALKEFPNASLYFAGYTNKDALSYAVGEEMIFDIYLLANNEVVSAPYFYYAITGEDGQQKTEGYADGSKGHFTIKAKLSKAGAIRINALVCDENKVKQTKNNSNLYVNLETSTPQTANLEFKGGAIAGLEQITTAGKVPTDLAEYWDEVINDCYSGDIKLLRFDELDPAAYGGTSAHKLYLFELECEGGFATGYLTVPQNKDRLKLRASFVSYGNKKKPSPSFLNESACISICAHSYHLDDPKAAAPDQYGFNSVENQNPDTVYFKNMFIRNLTATRFLKAFIGDGSYGRIVFNGQTIQPLNKWSIGDEFFVTGGSQASFQSVAIAAMDNDVTSASFGVPWFCDIGGDLVGRFSGWNPDYTDALMYYAYRKGR